MVGQQSVENKGGELGALRRLPEDVDISGRVVTGDAQFTQRRDCETIVSKGGDCYFVVKVNQKSLLEDIEAVWLDREPPSYERAGKRAGRVESRAIWTSQTLSGYTDWPHMAQVCRIERTETLPRR